MSSAERLGFSGLGTDTDFSSVRRLVDDVIERRAATSLSTSTGAITPAEPATALRALADFQEILLAETLRHVSEQTKFYPLWFASRGFEPLGFRSTEDLRFVPVLTRSDISDGSMGELHAKNCDVIGFRQTSGTTGSRRLVVAFTDEEMRYCRKLESTEEVSHPVGSPKRLIGNVRYVVRRYQSRWSLPRNDSVSVTVPFQFDSQANVTDYYDYVIGMAFERLEIPGVEPFFSALGFSPAFVLQAVTDQATARGIDLSRGSVRSIGCTGFPLSGPSLDRIAAAWGASVTAVYSCAELNAAAPCCSLRRGVYHFPPSLMVEVLRPETLEPVADGEDGLLVLTSLYPFQIATPFIRYWTGDIVRRLESCCSCGHVGPSIQLIGRNSNTLDLAPALSNQGGRRFLGAIDLIEALDWIGTLPRKNMYRFRLNSEQEASVLTITVGIEGRPEHVTDPNHPMRVALVKRLLGIDPQWEAAASAGRLRLTVEVAMVGFLDNAMVLKTT